MDTFRRYIYKRQLELGLSQNELASRAGRSGAWLSRFMVGDNKEIKLDSLIALAKALEVSEMKLIAAYKGEDPDEKENGDVAKYAMQEILSLLMKTLSPKVVADAVLGQDGEKKIMLLLKENMEMEAEHGNSGG